MATTPRNPMRAPWLDLRAHRIADPVARLRYLRREMRALEEGSRRRFPRKLVYGSALGILSILAVAWPAGTTEASMRERRMLLPAGAGTLQREAAPTNVWLVEHSDSLETYSNGLRIDLTFRVSNHARAHYPVFPLNGGAKPVSYGKGPVGIVYHTTESLLAPFDEEQSPRLKQLGRNVLEVIRRQHSYHYIIDRFARVYRVVEESDAANHSGYSVWADPAGVYVNLNDSFLAVAFEAQTGATEQVTVAQIAAARMLTEMLRSRYSIAAENCVTHAQVSVNPDNMRIGVHTDWASAFPFPALGLPNNYEAPLASLYAFGFDFDPAFLKATGTRWKGLDVSTEQVAAQAGAEGIPLARYRAMLQHRYKDILNTLQASAEKPKLESQKSEEEQSEEEQDEGGS